MPSAVRLREDYSAKDGFDPYCLPRANRRSLKSLVEIKARVIDRGKRSGA
jgi:hypothetical protein